MKTAKSFIAGFLVCAVLLTGAAALADGFWSAIDVLFNSVKINIDKKPVDLENLVYNGRTYVPLRDIAGLFGKAVEYDQNTQTIDLIDKEIIQMISKDVAFLVNGQPVRVDFFTQIANWYKTTSGVYNLDAETAAEFKNFVLEEVVRMCVIEQLAGDFNISITIPDKKQLDDNINIFATNYGGLDNFKAELESIGISYDTFYYIQTINALRSKVLDVVAPELDSLDLYAYYLEHKETMYKKEKVRAKHILFKTTDETGYPLPSEYKQKAKERAERVLKDIKTGKRTFDSAMEVYTNDPGYKTNPDGYTFARGEMVRIFETTAFSLEIGEISGIVESEYGYHIIKLEDRFFDYVPYETVKSSIYNILRSRQFEEIIEPKIQNAELILNGTVYENINIK